MLHVSSFGGGVVKAGAPDQRKIDEVLEADSLDIGIRGALVAASDVTAYTSFEDGGTVPALWTALRGLLATFPGFDQTRVLAVGEGNGTLAEGVDPIGPAYLLRGFLRTGEGAIVPPTVPTNAMTMDTLLGGGGLPPTVPSAEGVVVTGCNWPGVWLVPGGIEINISLICLGAREGFAPNSNAAFGLYVAAITKTSGVISAIAIGQFNALGTGTLGDGTGADTGTKAQQLYFRGVIDYNNHVFGWGFDSADTTNGDGPSRVMFCNLGKPLKWGNDNQGAVGVDRNFTDSDAIVLGDAGEIVRGAIKLFGKLFFGTNKGLHFIAGYGRDSFLTDGSTPVMNAFNVVGPHALIEGPDKLMYGVSDQGLWSFDGAGVPTPLFQKLVDFAGHSTHWWDLIWTDASAAVADPGRTNQDLVWTAVDWDRHQVLVGIPWCNAEAGYGRGEDTVVIKYHVLTGGFTRQVFVGVQYTAAAYSRRQGQTPDVRFMGTATTNAATIQRYAYKATAASIPIMPTLLPVATFGYYAPFGPDGRGSLKRIYLVLSWERAASLPIVFRITTTWDDALSDDFILTLDTAAPAAPATDDLWLDTSLADANIGNSLAGALISAFPAALLRRWDGSAWQQLPGVGSNGLRATIRLPLSPRNGTRFTVTAECTAAAGRFQLEGLGEKPAGGSAAE